MNILDQKRFLNGSVKSFLEGGSYRLVGFIDQSKGGDGRESTIE